MTRGAGLPVWRQVAARLAEEIGASAGPAGGRLPSEQDLARRFGVNRHTLRRALRELADRGLVRSEQGRGTFAAGGPPVLEYLLGSRTRLAANLEAEGRVPERRILAVGPEPAGATAARALGLEPGAPLTRVRALALADGVPLAVATVRLAAARFPDAAARLAEDSSFTRLYRAHGIPDYRRRSTRLGARLPEGDEAALLGLPADRPVLVTEGTDVEPDGRGLALALGVWAADRVQFVVGDG